MYEACTTCGERFIPQYAYQVATLPSGAGEAPRRQYFCQLSCRRTALGEVSHAVKRARRIAIGIEASWEVIENTSWLIDRYHAAALHRWSCS